MPIYSLPLRGAESVAKKIGKPFLENITVKAGGEAHNLQAITQQSFKQLAEKHGKLGAITAIAKAYIKVLTKPVTKLLGLLKDGGAKLIGRGGKAAEEAGEQTTKTAAKKAAPRAKAPTGDAPAKVKGAKLKTAAPADAPATTPATTRSRTRKKVDANA